MFGIFYSENNSRCIERVEFRQSDDSSYRASNSNHEVVIDTPFGRVFINEGSYFANVPQSAWSAAFNGELSPEGFLREKVGRNITDDEIKEFQALLSDLIDAEFASKNTSS